MPIHLRQICLVAETLEPCCQDIEAVFQTPVCHRDPEVATFGLENALFAVGSQFLEVVAPVKVGTAAGRFLERRGGGGGYMVICQIDSLQEQAAVRARARDNDVRVAFESDRGSWNILQFHPADMGAAFLEMDWDQQADPQGNWQPAGGLSWTDTPHSGSVTGIAAVDLSSPQPQSLAEHWSAVLGLPVTIHKGVPSIHLANADLRFVHGDTDASQTLASIEVTVADPAETLRNAESAALHRLADGFQLNGVNFRCQAAGPD